MQIMQRVAAEVVDNAHRAALNTASRTTKLVTQVTNLGSRPAISVCRSQKNFYFFIVRRGAGVVEQGGLENH